MELFGFRARAVEADLTWIEVLAGTKSELFINLANTTHPALVIP